MNILKEKIAEAISNHVSLEDTYTYELTRTKSAFEVGTMSLEDFEEWTEENVDDLAKEIVDTLQPQLNENQQQVLDWLKIGHCDGDSVFEALERITYVYEDPKTEEALESLSPDQEVQVINSFMKWALGQEEEK